LVFSLKIAEKRVEHAVDPDDIKPFLLGHSIQGFSEVEFFPRSDWRFGMDAARENDLQKIKVVESGMTDNPFTEDQTPVHLEVSLCHLPGWAPNRDRSADVPNEPPGLPAFKEGLVEGEPVTMTFVPYGATHLRLTTLPLIPSGISR
jgi:hypothetical protein